MVEFEEDRSVPTNAFAGMLGLAAAAAAAAVQHALTQQKHQHKRTAKDIFNSRGGKKKDLIYITSLTLFAECCFRFHLANAYVCAIQSHSPLVACSSLTQACWDFPEDCSFAAIAILVYRPPNHEAGSNSRCTV